MATTLQLPKTPDVAYFTNGAILGAGVTTHEDDKGLHIRGLKVFRTGKFADSQGQVHDWTDQELEAAVENFNALRDELPDVPVRVGHTRKAHDLAGYYEAVRKEGNFLVADILVTEPEVAGKVKRTTFRSRSIEIGAYPSAKYGLSWPVVLGLAFVDIPAVTGLYESPVGDKQFTVITESGTMSDQNKLFEFTLKGVKTTDYAAVQAALDEPAPKVDPPTFQCFGAPVVDPTKVQDHIAALETYQREAMDGARKAFVKDLVDKKILLETQKEPTEAFALALSGEQYEAWTKTFAGAQQNPLLQEHGGGNHGGQGAGDTNDPVKNRIEELEATVRFHKLGGKTDEFIAELPSYKELQSLKGQK